jgi:integrase
MKIKSYTLKFIALGKDKKLYLRYYVTDKGKPRTKNIDCDMLLTADQIKALNKATLGGNIQKAAFQIKRQVQDVIETLNLKNNGYPLPEEIETYFNVTEKQLHIDYCINQFMQSLKVKQSTKQNYGYVLHTFKKFFESKTSGNSIKEIVKNKTIKDYEFWLQRYYQFKTQAKGKVRIITPLTVHNNAYVIKMLLNFIADLYELPRLDIRLKQPKYSRKWHMSEEDVNRLLEYIPKNYLEEDVLDIIRINKNVGLRISEILHIIPENITESGDCTEIKFVEDKKSRERTIVIVDDESRKIISNRLLENKFWNIENYLSFDYYIKKIAKEMFGEATVKIYKVNALKTGYENVKKYNAISSHAFRRYAAAKNIVKYGIEVTRSIGGWSDYQVITRHYSEFMNKEDMKKKLLKNNLN